MPIDQFGNSLAGKLAGDWLRKTILTGAMILAVAACCLAQNVDPSEIIRIDSDLVSLQVNVLSQDPTKPPMFLLQRDFRVVDDGAPQEIAFFAAADAPFDLVLLLDLSGSTRDKLKLIRKSSRKFVEAARPLDRIAIVTFTDTVAVVSPLTSNHEELLQAIDTIEKPSGGTDFWDALRYVLLGVVRTGQTSRRSAIVVMTDGVDNALPDVPGPGSRTTFERLQDVVERSDAIIFPVYLDTEKDEVKRHRATQSAYVSARAQLTQLAEASGTLVHHADKLTDLEKVYEQIIRDLGTVYSIGYRPTGNTADGKWHKVSVAVVNRPDLTPRTRAGYYARTGSGSPD
jgi:VWFA-related protein